MSVIVKASCVVVSAMVGLVGMFGTAPAGAQSCTLQADHLLSFDGVLATNLSLPEGCAPEVYRLVVEALPAGVVAGTPASLDVVQTPVAIIDQLVGSDPVLFDPAIDVCGVDLQLDYGKLSLPGWDTFQLGVPVTGPVTGAVAGPEAAQFEHAPAVCSEAVVPLAIEAPALPSPPVAEAASSPPVVASAAASAAAEAPVAVLAANASRADQLGATASRQGLPATGGDQQLAATFAAGVIGAGLLLLLASRRGRAGSPSL